MGWEGLEVEEIVVFQDSAMHLFLRDNRKIAHWTPYLIVHDQSSFADHQTLKLQEAPDMVPVGELPRHMLLSADRYLTGRVVPGSRVIATGIYSTYEAAKSV